MMGRPRVLTPRVAFALVAISVLIGFCAVKHHRTPRSSRAPAPRLAALARPKPAPQHVVEIDELPRVALRRLMPEELTPELIQKADDLIWNHDAPLGTEVLTEADGKPF